IQSAWDTVCATHPMLRAKPNIAAENVTLGTAAAPVLILRQTKTTLAKLQSDTDALLHLLAPQRKALVQPFLVTCGDGVRCLVVLIHQFIADGFAHHILVRQLNATLAGQTLPNTDTHLELCRGDIDPQMAVPMDTIAPLNPGQQADFRTLYAPMPNDTWDQISNVAQTSDTTPFAIGLAAFSHLLERLSGRAFPVCFALQKRQTIQDFDAIGNATRPRFTQTQAKDGTLANCASALLGEILSDTKHEAVPHPDSTPCWFEIANEGASLVRMQGKETGLLRVLAVKTVDPGQPGIELSICPETAYQAGTFALHYDRNLLTQDQAQAMLDGFVCLLTHALSAPDAPLATLPTTPKAEPLPIWPTAKPNRFGAISSDFEQLCKDQPQGARGAHCGPRHD
ncbi:MAG: hypothetical protein ABJO59_12940, partial [Tateyamaria sp.]